MTELLPARDAAELDRESDAALGRGVRARCVAAIKSLACGRGTEELDAWLEITEPAQGLIAWFGASLPRDVGRLRLALDRDIAELDALLGAQVDAILHASAFQRLEAGWRGLLYLTGVADGHVLAKIRVLPITWAEVVRDLERAADFDQSQLFRKIYTEEIGTLGGEPFGLLVGDYEVQHRPSADHATDDIAALKSLAMIAAAAFAPMVLNASPTLLQLASFRDLGRPFDLRSVFQQAEYKRWQSMREAADMRFIGLVLPRVLMRLPYTHAHMRKDGFRYSEAVEGPNGSGYLWGNASFAFAAVTLRAFVEFGWFADIRGTPEDDVRGGMLDDLAVPSFATDAPGVALKPSTECALSDPQEKDLADLGFIGLRRVQYTRYSAFYANQSVQTPASYNQVAANTNARLSCMLQYMLCVSRFAHYIKVLGGKRVGTTTTADECERYLQQWLLRYCEGSDSASLETKARYPLREASIEVRETPGKAGSYACKVFLRPHFQLDDIATGFRLVTQLVPAANAV